MMNDNPQLGTVNYSYAFPIGLSYISAVLKQKNHEVRAVNLNHFDESVDNILKAEFNKFSYDCVITGGLSPFYPNVKTIVQCVRKLRPDIKIILGGGLVSSQPDIIFNMLEPDFGVIGEGEETIAELLQCLQDNVEPAAVNGLIYRDSNNQIRSTDPRIGITNLDSLPWPDYECLGFSDFLDHMYPSNTPVYDCFDYVRAYPIVSSRSCPFNCTFCYHPLGKKYRQRSVENIMEEIRYVVMKYHINILEFYDELFAQNRERVAELCRSLKEFTATVPWEVKWICAMRVDCLEEDVVKQMKDAGCYFFSLGLESMSPIVLKSMKKHITPEQIDRALRLCKQFGISVQGNFIFGDIAETTQTYKETLNYWKNHRDLCESSVGLLHITMYQGSYIYKHALETGIIKDEVKFIEEREKKYDAHFAPMNFTDGMTDAEYQQMLVDFKEAQSILKYYAVPEKTTWTGDSAEIQVKCPFCGEVSIYKNFHISPEYERINICCRKCRSRYIVASKKMRLKFLFFRIAGFKIPYYFGKWLYDSSEYLPPSLKNRIKKLLAG